MVNVTRFRMYMINKKQVSAATYRRWMKAMAEALENEVDGDNRIATVPRIRNTLIYPFVPDVTQQCNIPGYTRLYPMLEIL